MRIGVHGLGYVGSVNAVALALAGHDVIATDVDERRVAAMASGKPPVPERGLAARLVTALGRGRLRATIDGGSVAASTDVSLVCVGTPACGDGSVDLDQVRAACTTIGRALMHCSSRHVVAVRSTVPPGTTRNVIGPLVESASGLRRGAAFGVAFFPEFLREGRALADFEAPSRTVVGETDARDGDRLLAMLPSAIAGGAARVDPETAELVKHADNAWHALKVAFGNEIGAIAERLGVDPQRAMALFTADTTLNLSAAYLEPGAPYGGGCLPKDLASLGTLARMLGLETPLIAAVEPSNAAQLERIVQRVADAQRVGIVGLGFKPGVADLRGSPSVALGTRIEALGALVRWYDANPALVAVGPWAAERRVPSLDALAQWADAIVVMHADASLRAALSAIVPARTLVVEAGRAASTAPVRRAVGL